MSPSFISARNNIGSAISTRQAIPGNKRSARIRNQQQNPVGEQDNTELDEEDDDDCGGDCDEHQQEEEKREQPKSPPRSQPIRRSRRKRNNASLSVLLISLRASAYLFVDKTPRKEIIYRLRQECMPLSLSIDSFKSLLFHI